MVMFGSEPNHIWGISFVHDAIKGIFSEIWGTFWYTIVIETVVGEPQP